MPDDASLGAAAPSLTLALDFDLIVAFRPEAALRASRGHAVLARRSGLLLKPSASQPHSNPFHADTNQS
jgi:hypothetical protein